MFSKKTTRSAIIGLLIASSCQIFVNEATAIQLNVMGDTNSQNEVSQLVSDAEGNLSEARNYLDQS